MAFPAGEGGGDSPLTAVDASSGSSSRQGQLPPHLVRTLAVDSSSSSSSVAFPQGALLNFCGSRHEMPKVPENHTSGMYISATANFACSNAYNTHMLRQVEGQTFGSKTAEYEVVHRESVQIINFLSSLYESSPGLSRTANGTINCSKQSVDSCVPSNDEKGVIIIDSDDEEDAHVNQNHGKPSMREFLLSKIRDRINARAAASSAASSATSSACRQLVPYVQQNGLDSHSTSVRNWQPSIQFEKVVLERVSDDNRVQDQMAANIAEQRIVPHALGAPNNEKNIKEQSFVINFQRDDTPTGDRKRKRNMELGNGERKRTSVIENGDFMPNIQKPAKLYDEVELEPIPESESSEEEETDGLEEEWNNFSFAIESIRAPEEAPNVDADSDKYAEVDCNHDFIIKDDVGKVCVVCGMVQKKIETIFDYQWGKPSRVYRSLYPSSRNSKEHDDVDYAAVNVADHEFKAADISIHPRHEKQMRPHQLEGFRFLVKNLVSDPPSGCILAHAPGSGKTFMLISFIQSFLAKFPAARPLVVLPKGILPTWKQEFLRWQVEDIPLHDLYSLKSGKRRDQLELLKAWQEKRSILLVGYKQFSTIICDTENDKATTACQELLLNVPSLLILDEGHTPRNAKTDVLTSLGRVQTRRKVVLSGTLYQNHVLEVINILNLVQPPKFLSLPNSRPIVDRIYARVDVSSSKKLPKGAGADQVFSESVEETLQKSCSLERKTLIIKDLRKLTKDVLHYYKGDFLDELPGLVDIAVLLKLSKKQQEEVDCRVGKHEKFKLRSVACAIYMHPCLSEISEIASEDRDVAMMDDKIDSMIEQLTDRDLCGGIKTKFFLDILSLAQSKGEKVLAFSQYLLPMKFLERYLVVKFGWRVGTEVLMISGETSLEDRDKAMAHFNTSLDAKVLFGSIKACGEGISLVGASRVVILDVHLNPSVTRQAIGRAFRPGQEKKVYTYRVVAADSAEEQLHDNAFQKEIIPKMWFEWSEFSGKMDFKLQEVDIDDCEDDFLKVDRVRRDIKKLYIR